MYQASQDKTTCDGRSLCFLVTMVGTCAGQAHTLNVWNRLTQYLVGLQELKVCLKQWPNHLFHSVIRLHHTGALGFITCSVA